MSGHTYIHTYIHTYTQDNYSNPRCAHARRRLMNKQVGMLLQKRTDTSGVKISNTMRISIKKILYKQVGMLLQKRVS